MYNLMIHLAVKIDSRMRFEYQVKVITYYRPIEHTSVVTTGVRFVMTFANKTHDVIYKTRCPTLFHTKHHQSSFIGNFHIFCHRIDNDNGFVVFCSDLSFHWYIGH